MAGGWPNSLLVRWVRLVVRMPWPVLTVLGLVTAVSAWFAVERFAMNSDLGDLIRQEAPWRDDFDRYEAAFPDLVETAVIVVSGTSFKGVEDTARAIEAAVRAEDAIFRAVYAPQNDPFFRRHALLYLEPDDLDDMADRLAEAQPVLTAVAEDPSLRGVLELVLDGVEETDETDGVAGLDTIIRLLTESGAAVLDGDDPQVRWTDELFETDDTLYRLVLLKGRADYGVTLPNAEIMSHLRALIAGTPVADGVEVAITGEVALAHEEIEAAITGVQRAGWVAVVLLAAVLILGVRSVKIIAATFVMLLVGVAWTSAWAMLTVGEYNTLSIVFLVMFFGLGVDFSLHYSLRYQEAVNDSPAGEGGHGSVMLASLELATASVGRAISVCTLTTALGFLSFVPTPYAGLADLGVISAGGMVVAGFLTFTLLPALYAVSGPIRPHVVDLPTGDALVRFLVARRGAVLLVLGAAAVAGTVLAARAEFDYSVLALKDPQAESVRTLRVLQREGIATDYALNIVSADRVDGDALEALAEVDSVTTPDDLVPADQDEKLFVLDDLQQLLWSAVAPARTAPPPEPVELAAAVERLHDALARAAAAPRRAELARVLERLRDAPPAVLLAWQRGVVENLVEELAWLREALQVGELSFDDLPASVRERTVADAGERLTVVTPAEDVSNVAALSRFIEAVRDRYPSATGRPVIEWGVGGIVVASFQQALVFATLSILVVLLVVFRNVRDALLILVPLALAALFTMALGVAFGYPLNMANILVLPLIFGLGVDNGIHVVDRFRGAGDVAHLMHSSTPRAVMLSTLTTIGTFAALSLSPHAGTASIGVLLTIAVAMLLVFTVFLLPVLLSLLDQPQAS